MPGVRERRRRDASSSQPTPGAGGSSSGVSVQSLVDVSARIPLVSIGGKPTRWPGWSGSAANFRADDSQRDEHVSTV